jgi:hypothetical protein
MASETMEGNADQFREVWLRIETGRTGVEGIPIGIEFDFQFQIPMHAKFRWLHSSIFTQNLKGP